MMSSSNNSGYITVDQANKMLLKQNTVNTSRDPRAYSKVAIPPISTNLDTSDRTSGISSNSTNNSGASAYSMASGIPRNQLTSGQNQLTSYPPKAQNKQDGQFRPPQPASATICAAGGATALLSPLPVKNNSSNHNEKEAQIGEKRPNCSQQGNLDLAWLAENPAFLAACYCLALLHQLGGLDFLSLLGMVLAMTSMVSMFFL